MTRPTRSTLRSTRDWLVAYARTYEDGITASVFAIALLVLLGMVALGIDGSRIYDERRHAQNAADHAAIAAAFTSCTINPDDAVAAGEDSAAENGYNDDEATNWVEILHEGDTTTHRYTATVDTIIGTTFGQVIGFATLETNAFARAEATGCDASGASQAAVWAGGHNCDPGSLRNIEISGNGHTVNGLTYTNGSFFNGGGDPGSAFLNTAPHPSVRYVSSFVGGSTPPHTYSPAEDQISLPPSTDRWPGGFDPDPTSGDMTEAMWNAYRDAAIAGGQTDLTPKEIFITGDGVYYTERTADDIEIKSIVDGAEFVVVSKFRPVKTGINQSGLDFFALADNPAGTPDNVIVVTGFTDPDPCDKFAFERSGEGGHWHGFIWAPRAMARISGNDSEVTGGVISWGFQMNGNDHVINGGTGAPAAEPDVFLTD